MYPMYNFMAIPIADPIVTRSVTRARLAAAAVSVKKTELTIRTHC